MKLTTTTVVCLLISTTLPSHAEDKLTAETFHFGKTAEEIEQLGYYGRKLLQSPQRGLFNVSDKFHYSEQFQNDNPYVTEVGFLNGQAVYFLFRKAALEPSRTLNDAEIFSLLDRCAGEVDWDEQSKKQSDGRLFKYDSSATNIYAYLNSGETTLFVWTTVVAPNVAKLDRNPGLMLAFADEQEIPLLEADKDTATAVLFVDAELPVDTGALEHPGSQKLTAATALDKTFSSISSEKIRYFADEEAYELFREKQQQEE